MAGPPRSRRDRRRSPRGTPPRRDHRSRRRASATGRGTGPAATRSSGQSCHARAATSVGIQPWRTPSSTTPNTMRNTPHPTRLRFTRMARPPFGTVHDCASLGRASMRAMPDGGGCDAAQRMAGVEPEQGGRRGEDRCDRRSGASGARRRAGPALLGRLGRGPGRPLHDLRPDAARTDRELRPRQRLRRGSADDGQAHPLEPCAARRALDRDPGRPSARDASRSSSTSFTARTTRPIRSAGSPRSCWPPSTDASRPRRCHRSADRPPRSLPARRASPAPDGQPLAKARPAGGSSRPAKPPATQPRRDCTVSLIRQSLAVGNRP